jgi:alpha-amylase
VVNVCFYFQVHQPRRLRNYSVFDIGKNSDYYNDDANQEILKRIVEKCYIPMNDLLFNLIKKHNGAFKVSFSISGTALEQFKKFAPDVLDSFKKLAKTGCVDFLSETYNHSLSFLFSEREFTEQVMLHKKAILDNFGVIPKVFRNTELIFNNDIAHFCEKIGFSGVLAEGADNILEWRSPNYLYTSRGSKNVKLALKNYKLSDDIAFRFSNRAWTEYPLTPKKFAGWIHACSDNADVINLFMDYETFGEHQWEETGIFEFMENLPDEIFALGDSFCTVTESIESFTPSTELDIQCPISWADQERDLSAWMGNKIQVSALKRIYDLEEDIKASGDEDLLKDWRNMTTSDHFYYMCTKWFNDGDVHKYFNPYDSPYDAFIIMMNVCNDIQLRLKDLLCEKKEGENAKAD